MQSILLLNIPVIWFARSKIEVSRDMLEIQSLETWQVQDKMVSTLE